MRIHVKKKRYQMHCREQTLAGKATDSGGNWRPQSSQSAVDHNVYYGTLGSEPGVGRPKKGGAVHWVRNMALHTEPRWYPKGGR